MNVPLPPGRTERVLAARVLVLAPHPDDEVLGCGGLLAQLVRHGAEVRVLLATDGAGGVEQVEDRAAYAERRRREAAAAAAVLGVTGLRTLELPDGALAGAIEPLATALGRELVAHRPELLLVPSPLDLTADHRAAFAAVHRLLGGLRDDPGATDGDRELRAAVAGLRILVYEINRPAFPDLLVDVSAEEELLARAMACYPSQEERHPYLAASMALRRYRCLTLSPEVRAAEGYRQLTPADFATRSLAALVAELGGAPALDPVRDGQTVSVVVRTRDRPRLLAEALASLAASSYRRAEVVVVNDGGGTPALPGDFPLPLSLVEHTSARGRAAAANTGLAAAGGELVTFLDDDDLVYPEHLATLAAAARGLDAPVVYSDAAVVVYELDPAAGGWRAVERRLPYSRDFDPDLLLVDNYIPFNTLAIRRELLRELGETPLDPALPFFEDWDLLIRLAERTPFQHLRTTTCEYRHFRGSGHHIFGERPDTRADFLATKARVIERHRARLGTERLARVVDRLRAETVARAEEAASRQAALDRQRDETRRLEAAHRQLAEEHRRLDGAYAELDRRYWDRERAYHALNGDHAALAAERARLEAAVGEQGRELDRLFTVERELRETAAAQVEVVAGLHRELAAREVALAELHPVRGELVAVRAELEQTLAALATAQARERELTATAEGLVAAVDERHREIARLNDEQERLAQVIAGLQATIAEAQSREGELLAEVARLGALIETMQGTKAWRLHQAVERLRGRR